MENKEESNKFNEINKLINDIKISKNTDKQLSDDEIAKKIRQIVLETDTEPNILKTLMKKAENKIKEIMEFKELHFEIIGNRKNYPDRYEPMKCLRNGIKDISCEFRLNDDNDKIEALYKCPETGKFKLFGYVNPEADLTHKCNSAEYFKELLKVYNIYGEEPEIEAKIVGYGNDKAVIPVFVDTKIYFNPEMKKAIEAVEETFYKRDLSLRNQLSYYENMANSEAFKNSFLADKFNELENYEKKILFEIKEFVLKNESIDFNDTIKRITPEDLENSNISNALIERATKYESIEGLDLNEMINHPIEFLGTLRGIDFKDEDLIQEVVEKNNEKKQFGED